MLEVEPRASLSYTSSPKVSQLIMKPNVFNLISPSPWTSFFHFQVAFCFINEKEKELSRDSLLFTISRSVFQQAKSSWRGLKRPYYFPRGLQKNMQDTSYLPDASSNKRKAGRGGNVSCLFDHHHQPSKTVYFGN